jgi:hypothetical protein
MTQRSQKPDPRKAPQPADLMKVIRRLVEQQRITYTRHAFEVRMPKRGFDPGDVEKVLSRGSIEGKISAGRAVGEWQCLMVAKLELRGRDVG